MIEAADAQVSTGHGHLVELRKEAYTMALYVAICLLAALSAVSETDHDQSRVIGIVWGVTIGLALAHWFAFRVSARMIGAGNIRSEDIDTASAQLAGAAAVALLASIPVLLAAESDELELTTSVLAGFIAVVGFAVARGGGASRRRAIAYAGVVLVVAVVIVVVKNSLAGH
jgi:hypothetical protein